MITQAIILIAGYETRLSPLTDEKHQCLFDLGEQTVLEDLLGKLVICGITSVVLVVGHQAELIKKCIGNSFKGLSVDYIYNEKFLTTSVSYSLWLAREKISGACAVIDGDMIFEEKMLVDFFDAPSENLIAVDFSRYVRKNEAVVAHVQGAQVLEIGKHVKVKDTIHYARFLGLSKFSVSFGRDLFCQLDTLEQIPSRSRIYEDAINLLLEMHRVDVFNSRRYNWFEIDNVEEFEKAKKIFGDTQTLAQKAISFGADDVYVMLPDEIVFDDRAKLQCFNCKNYGRKRTCPPSIPDWDYQKMILKYRKGLFVIIRMDSSLDFDQARFESTNKLHQILLKLEKEAFNQNNHFTTSFIGGSCKLCENGCAEICRLPQYSRIPIEAIGVDVVETMRKFGLILQFPAKECIYRIGALLIG